MTPTEAHVVSCAVAWAGAYTHAREAERWPEALALVDAVNALVRDGIVARLPEERRALPAGPGAEFVGMTEADIEDIFGYEVEEP